ncbi:MAG: acyl-CoA dehydrogenase C-terminal domain-containing protein, partial [Betaproteobacteria bacterium]
MLGGNLMVGWQLARALMVAEDRQAAGEDEAFMAAKAGTARFYVEHILARVSSLRDAIVEGGDSVMALAAEAF